VSTGEDGRDRGRAMVLAPHVKEGERKAGAIRSEVKRLVTNLTITSESL
jgi:hypothetical protein